MEMAPGTIVDGRYRLLARLGIGGMAEVWSAEDTELGREVALKLLYPRLAADNGFVERFRREASAAAGLQHPNVVQVYDRGESQGTYYIAMEYLRGPSLKDLVRRGPISPAHAVELVTQVLKGARFAHRRGIIHRDLKPHNVLLDDEGRVKVTDFGIARAGASDMTETGSILGTAQYLSPEQAQGHAVTERSDLYSIGVILFELLTGRVPFDGEAAVSIALRHVSEPAPAPSQLNPAVPPWLDSVVLRALAKDPAQRFRDADEFIAALNGAPTQAPAATEATRIAAAPVSYPPPSETYDAAEPEGRSGSWLWWLAGVLVLVALGLGAYLMLQGSQVRVPDVVGRSAQGATATLERRGFEVSPQSVESDDVARGRVVSQDPSSGQEVSEGSVVTIAVSTGPGEEVVPDVAGRSRDEATEVLEEAGFEVRPRRAYSDTVPEGDVIETDPAAGETATRGSRVSMVVSRGVQPVTVPDVTTLDRAAATRAIRDAGLSPVVEMEESDEEEPGQVLEQSPGPGSEVEEGSEVTIVVAEAPPEVDIPDLLGLPERDAIVQLREAELKPRRNRVPATTPQEHGVVLGQDPPAGEQRPQGSTVTIDVGRFAPENPDPNADPGAAVP